MSKIALTPNASGTGTFTLAAPNSNTSRTITLPDEAGEVLVNTASGVDITGTLTSDGLTVDNSGTIQFNDPQATDTILIGTNDNDLVIRTDDGVIQLKTNENKVGFQLANNGDISFYEDTGTTPKFFWDASAERLGIGTSSPSNDIHISSSSGTKAVFERTGSTGAYIGLKDSSGSNVYLGDNNGTFEVQTAGSSYSTKLAVTSGGNVGIGVTTPRGLLHVNQATASSDAIIRITNSNTPSTGNHRVEFADGTGTSEGSTVFRYAYIAGERSGGSNDGHFIVGTKPNNSSAPTERMRIDSSGQLTNTSNTTALAASFLNTNTSGYGMRVTTYSNATQYGLAVDSYGGGYSRDFTVGVDGNVNVLTGNLVIGTAGKGIDFSATSNGSGTTTSELLDDYEEGTWTPTITGGTLASDYQAGAAYQSTYTKIGRMVVLEFMISLSSITSGSHLMFTNLPFTSKSGIWGGGIWTNGWASEPSSTVRWWNSGTTLHFYESNGSGSVTQLTQGDMGTGGNIFGNIIYYTS